MTTERVINAILLGCVLAGFAFVLFGNMWGFVPIVAGLIALAIPFNTRRKT